MIGASRNPYYMLEPMPKFSVFCFYCGSIITGLWHVIKLFMYFLWNWIIQIMQIKAQTSDKNIMDGYDGYDGGYHDKPPQCLVDNALGRQLYVKLKVFFCYNNS